MQSYLAHLRMRVGPAFESRYAPLLHAHFYPRRPFAERVARILMRVAIALRSSRATTISDIVRQQVADSVLDAACLGPSMTSARHLIFCIQCWATLLYEPCLPDLPDSDLFGSMLVAHRPSTRPSNRPTRARDHSRKFWMFFWCIFRSSSTYRKRIDPSYAPPLSLICSSSCLGRPVGILLGGHNCISSFIGP